MAFPVADAGAIASMFSNLSIAPPPPSSSSSSASGASGPAPPHRSSSSTGGPPVDVAAALPRVRAELQTVRQRVADVAKALVGGAATPDNASFLDGVDFLEQCTERLRDLVEAGEWGVRVCMCVN